MPSCNTYHLTWICLTLGVVYLFSAAPAKHSLCSLPWMRCISLRHPSWPSTCDSSSRPSCAHTATAPWVAPPGHHPWPQAWGGFSRLYSKNSQGGHKNPPPAGWWDFPYSSTCEYLTLSYTKLTFGTYWTHYLLINMPLIHTSNYNRLNYGKDMHGRASCNITCSYQLRLSIKYLPGLWKWLP